MKTLNAKQTGFFDPVFGLILFGLMGLTSATVISAHKVDSELQTASVETEKPIVHKN